LVEFTDYECPFCQRYASDTQPQISKEYVETGKVRQVFMDYPLTGMHRMAQKAAEAGQCAQDQGKFWEMSDKLFENPSKDPKWLTPENILKLAEGFGLDMTAFKTCLDSGKHAADVKSRIAEGGKAQMTGAPAFYLGSMMPDGKVKVTKQLKGALPFASFKTAIDEMLAPKKAEEKPAPKK
jgi:protein-disulfide isomerase